MVRRMQVVIFCLLTISLIVASSPPSAQAYDTGSKWINAPSTTFGLASILNSDLGITSAPTQVSTAANRWNRASWFKLYQVAYSATNNVITTQNFQTSPPCGSNDNAFAVVCISASNGVISQSPMYINKSPSISWNTSGASGVNCSASPRRMDFLNVVTHEFGHFFSLFDHPAGNNNAIMNFDCTYKVDPLRPDDTAGATQLYGPQTGFETGEALGYSNILAYSSNTTGYYGSGAPELGVVSSEFGVPVSSGSKYLRIAGNASGNSYAYFKLFSSDFDTSAIPFGIRRYLEVRSGMTLKWRQYNYKQTNASIDLVFTDGTTLRDLGFKDQNGVGSHPAARTNYPTGQWLYFQVDLSLLSTKRIKDILIAYDNGGNGRTGQFRSYFDDIQIAYN